MPDNTKTIVICGGHMTPALAVMDAMHRVHKEWNIVYVGRKYAFGHVAGTSSEETIMKNRGVRFYPLTTARYAFSYSPFAILSFWKILLGCVQSMYILLRERPNAVMSFGGYIAVPVVFVAWMLKIPACTHEQTRVPGKANRLLSRFVKCTFISYPETTDAFEGRKTHLTGLPIRDEVFKAVKSVPKDIPTTKPLLYITGGSTGATSMNALLFPLIARLAQRYTIVHQTGIPSHKEAIQVQHTLPKNLKASYVVFPYISGDLYSWIVQHAKLVIARSGANTVAELSALGTVALYIPLPWSSGDEQRLNAKESVSAGGSVMFEQDNATAETLATMIESVESRYDVLKKNAREYATKIPKDAAANIVREIEKYMS